MKAVIVIAGLCVWMGVAYLAIGSAMDRPKCNPIGFAEWLGLNGYTLGCNISFDPGCPDSGKMAWYQYNNEKREYYTDELYNLYLTKK